MIEFLTLFFGLVTGHQAVEVAVGPEVAAVELRLDGAPAATLAGPPWRAEIDLGAELAPHQLVAVALGAGGEEIARAHQGINRPDNRIGATTAVERDAAGRPVAATVTWDRRRFGRPEAVRLFVDGEERPAAGADRFALPALDPGAAHLLSAELSFGGNLRATATFGLGGDLGAGPTEEVTAVAVASTSGDGPPVWQAVAGVLLADGEPARPLAVTVGGGDVVIVRDPAASDALVEQLAEAEQRLAATEIEYREDVLRLLAPLGRGLRVSLLWTTVAEVAEEPEARFDLFSISPLYRRDDGGLSWLLGHFDSPPIPERIADAVCVAGLLAAAAERPRAVVLIVHPETADGSLHDAATARRFLARLGVPLRVWTPAEAPGELGRRWGDVVSVATPDRLIAAADELRRLLDSQAIAWLAGRHPPAAVALAPGAAGVALAGADLTTAPAESLDRGGEGGR